jgi:hypothetical protein
MINVKERYYSFGVFHAIDHFTAYRQYMRMVPNETNRIFQEEDDDCLRYTIDHMEISEGEWTERQGYKEKQDD